MHGSRGGSVRWSLSSGLGGGGISSALLEAVWSLWTPVVTTGGGSRGAIVGCTGGERGGCDAVDTTFAGGGGGGKEAIVGAALTKASLRSIGAIDACSVSGKFPEGGALESEGMGAVDKCGATPDLGAGRDWSASELLLRGVIRGGAGSLSWGFPLIFEGLAGTIGPWMNPRPPWPMVIVRWLASCARWDKEIRCDIVACHRGQSEWHLNSVHRVSSAISTI